MSVKQKSIVLLQGIPKDSFLKVLTKKKFRNIYVLEGRPRGEGVALLCEKLLKRKIKPTLIADNMAGFLFYKNLVKEVWIAYQSLHQNGAFCSMGALILGVLGKHHRIPVYLVPSAIKTDDMGRQEDILRFQGARIAPKGVKGYVPLIERVPQQYISEIYYE